MTSGFSFSAILQAVHNGSAEQVSHYLSHTPFHVKSQLINQLNTSDGLGLLHLACRFGNAEVAEVLLNHGANINLPTKHEEKHPIHLAAKFCKQIYKKSIDTKVTSKASDIFTENKHNSSTNDCLQVLIDHDANVNARDIYRATPLHYACEKGCTKAVETLLQSSSIVLQVFNDHLSSPLHEAARHGSAEIVNLLLSVQNENEFLLKFSNESGCTPLILACRYGHKDTADVLLKTSNFFQPGGTLMRMLDRDTDSNTSLHAAVENGHLDVVKLLFNTWDEESLKFKEQYDYYLNGDEKFVDLKNANNLTALHLAAYNNNNEMLKLILERNPDLNPRNHINETPLFVAAKKNHQKCVNLLLKSECDTELSDTNGLTPLLVACKNDHADIVESLLNHGADVRAKDNQYRNCLLLAAEYGSETVMQALFNYSSCKEILNATDKFENSALHKAAEKGNVYAVKFLVKSGISLNVRNDLNQTVLHLAAANKHIKVIKYIVAIDSSLVNEQDEQFQTPLHLAALSGNIETVQELIKLGAKTDQIDVRRWTALHISVSVGWVECVEYLLETNPSLANIRTRTGETALHLACNGGSEEIIKLLLKHEADVKPRLPDGRNSLDVAIDNCHEGCARVMVEHDSWKNSLRNATTDHTLAVTTPFRKLVRNMPEVAEVVLTKCMMNGCTEIDSEEFEVIFDYEFLEDTYMIRSWIKEMNTIADDNNQDVGINVNTQKNSHAIDYYQPSIVDEVSYERNQNNIQENCDHKDIMSTIVKSVNPYSEKASVLHQNHPLKIMVSLKHEKLLRHPTVISLSNYKWNKFGRYLFFVNFLFYCLYMFFFNLYMLGTPPRFAINATRVAQDITEGKSCISVVTEAEDVWGSSCQGSAPLRYITIVLTYTFCSLHLLKEALQMYHQRFAYFKNYSNYVEIALYGLSIVVFLDFDQMARTTGIRLEWQWECGAFALLLAWLNLLVYIRRTALGIYVFMVTSVTWSFIRFGLVMMIFLLGFSFSFYVLLQNQYPFYTPITSVVKTLTMMVGEMDYSSIFLNHFTSSQYQDLVHYEIASYLIFIFFIFCMSLLVTNLLVGIAVGDIALVYNQATLRRLAVQVEGVLDMEYAFPTFIRRRLVVLKSKLKINSHRDRSAYFRWLLLEENIKSKEIISILQRKKQSHCNAEDKVESLRKVMQNMSCTLNKLIDRQDEIQQELQKLTKKANECNSTSPSNLATGKRDNLANALDSESSDSS